MKLGKLALLLPLLLLHASAGAQEPSPPPRPLTLPPRCPVISVSCPDGVRGPGTPVTFTVSLTGEGAGVPHSFTWTVTAGAISSGGGGPAVTVDTTGISGGSVLTATVEVGGLDRSCHDTASCSTVVHQPLIVEKFDFYGSIRFEDEQARLDNFAISALESPEFNAYIVCYGGRRGYRGEARARCERAKRYLVGRRHVAPERIVLVDGGFMEELQVSLWLLPPGTKFTPSPTVAPEEVEFIRKPSAGRAGRRGRARAH